jgi:phosphoribosylformylglycinamidine cyclo-ligase
MMNLPATYAAAGVDIEAGNDVVRRIKPHAQRTFTPGVLTGLGGFGALFQHDFSQYSEPVMVSSTDGVGTKLKLAFALDKHDTVGIDLVAMCANDVLCCGAAPLFFLDYFATGKLLPETAEAVVKGIADGCVESGCALIGGETAELPGFYSEGEYDLAGFCVGAVEKSKILTGETIEAGDVVLGLPSSGLHSNGYSLARKVLEPLGYDTVPEGWSTPLGAAMLTPTRLYVKPVLDLLAQVKVKGIVHITGGGFYENIPRVLPTGRKVVIEKGSWPIPPIFSLIESRAQIAEREMFTTFNMGVGLVLVLSPENERSAREVLGHHGLNAPRIGRIEATEDAPHVELI